MAEKKCPYYSSQSFYFKAPQDEYEIYEFDLKGGEIVFSLDNLETDWPKIHGDTETYCSKCS